jgi:hypothetical protein
MYAVNSIFILKPAICLEFIVKKHYLNFYIGFTL